MIPFLKFTGAKSFSSLQDGELRSQDAPFVIQFDFSGQKAGAVKRYLHKLTNKTIRISILTLTVMSEFWARTGNNFRIFAEKKKKGKNKITVSLRRLVFLRAHTIFPCSPPTYVCVGSQSGIVVINHVQPLLSLHVGSGSVNHNRTRGPSLGKPSFLPHQNRFMSARERS